MRPWTRLFSASLHRSDNKALLVEGEMNQGKKWSEFPGRSERHNKSPITCSPASPSPLTSLFPKTRSRIHKQTNVTGSGVSFRCRWQRTHAAGSHPSLLKLHCQLVNPLHITILAICSNFKFKLCLVFKATTLRSFLQLSTVSLVPSAFQHPMNMPPSFSKAPFHTPFPRSSKAHPKASTSSGDSL